MKFHLSWILVAAGLLDATPTGAMADDVHDLLPGNTQAVLSCNVKQVLAYDLFQNALPKIREGIQEMPEANFLMTTLGFDPLKDVERVILATPNVNDEDELLVVVKGKFDLRRIKTLAQSAAKEKPTRFKIHQHNGQTLYEAWLPEGEKPTFLAFADAQTLLVSVQRKYVTDAVDVHAGKKKSALSKELCAVIKKANPKQCSTLSALGQGFTGASSSADKVDQFYGGLTISDAVYADFKVTTQDAGSAIRIADDLKEAMKAASQLMTALAEEPQEQTLVKEVLDRCKISVHGTTVTMTARISVDMIQKLMAKGE